MEPQNAAWEQFLRTGRVSDYLSYCQTFGILPIENDAIEGEDYPNAEEYPSGSNWHAPH